MVTGLPFNFAAQCLCKRGQKCFGCAVNRLEGRRHGSRDRGSEEDAAAAVPQHIFDNPLGEMDRRDDVEVYEIQFRFQVRAGEISAHANAGVDRDGVRSRPVD